MSPNGSNPFATRFTRPGAIAYQLPEEVVLGDLVGRLRQADWRGEIIGPHGTGKSTLLASLAPELAAAGRAVHSVTLTAGDSTLPVADEDVARWHSATLLIVDGYEQLGWPSRLWLQATLARTGAGLLVTAHEPQGFATIWATGVDSDLAWRIVTHLQPASYPSITPNRVAELMTRHAGNLREVLFDLYDVCQGDYIENPPPPNPPCPP